MIKSVTYILHAGNRFYGETLQVEDIRKDFEERLCDINGDNSPAQCNVDEFSHYIRTSPPTSDLNQFNGNHFIYGEMEGLFQSDRSPIFALTEYNNFEEFTYEIIHNNE